MPTIAELKARKANGAASGTTRETVTVTLIEGQHLVDAWMRLENERLDLLAQVGRTDDGDEPAGPPRKTSQGLPSRLPEIEAEKTELNSRMAEFQGELTYQSRQVGEWLRWCSEHPAREDNEVDQRLTAGQCNAEDLLNDLGSYAVAWDGEALEPGDWDAIDIVPGDLQDLVQRVVFLHGQRFDRVPKSLPPSSTTTGDEND